MKTNERLAIAILLAAVLSACSQEPAPANTQMPLAAATEVMRPLPTVAPTEVPAEPTVSSLPLFSVVDGDTVDITVNRGTFRARLIGIDTPEVGQPGANEATRAVVQWLADRAVLVVDSGKLDKYDRHLIYLQLPGGGDLGLYLIQHGFAIARYDSRDGYDWHEYEDRYHEAEQGYVQSQPTQTMIPTPRPAPTGKPPAPTQPTSSVYYANCSEAKAAGAAPIYRGEPGYRSALDRDDDGIACEG